MRVFAPQLQSFSSAYMLQRNRNRGSTRNNGGEVGEEAVLWKTCQTQLQAIVEIFNEHADNAQRIYDLDKIVASNKKAHSQGFQDTRNQLEDTIRAGVRMCERDKLSNTSSSLQHLIEHLEVLKAIQEGKEKSELMGRRREKDPYDDFTSLGGSPGPRPPKFPGTPRSGTPNPGTRKGSEELEVRPGGGPGSSSGVGGSGSSSRTKITFAKDEEVAFKPKAQPASIEQTDWILGIVQQVLGDGKSRRYKVLDPEPEDATGKQKEYRTSASSMIPITSAANAASLPEWDKGKTVLALYPGTTTFYKAEVMMTDDEGKVHLRFEGEENNSVMQMVERRYVVEYR